MYLFFKKLIVPETNRKLFVSKHIKAQKGDNILDIGCGPADVLDLLPEVNYVGFDMNPLYIEYAKKKYAGRGKFSCERVSSKNIITTGYFDIILAYGILNHLNNEEFCNFLISLNLLLSHPANWLFLMGVILIINPQ